MTDRPPDLGFTPISPNPYIVGNPVRDRSMFFGREAEFELVRRRFQQSTRGGLLVFCGERRSGKTSILFQIVDQRLGPDFIPVLIDMQSMAVGNEIEFLTRVSEEVLAALGPQANGIAPPEFTSDSNHSAKFQKFIRDVLRAQPGRKLILLFDEYELFENKIDSGQLAQDVLHILANLMETEPVFLVFTGSQSLDQRKRQYWSILGKSIYRTISFLDREDAMSLIRKPVEGRVRYAEGTVELIFRLTAGQPFYTQAICQNLVDHLNDLGTDHATRETVMEVVDRIVDNPLPQMVFLWDGLERGEKLVLALLAERLTDRNVYAEVDELTNLFRHRDYPAELDKARIATTLEKLFKSEMLLRSDWARSPEYAFRMDLWRLWIRRQHSVWQVMREEGIEIRPGPAADRRSRVARWVFGSVAGAAILAMGLRLLLPRHDQPGAGSAPAPPHAAPVVETDSTPVREAPVPVGDLTIETQPSGADVWVDGHGVGRSPLTVRGLTAEPHRVEALRRGYGAAEQEVSMRPNGVINAMLVLEAGKANVMVTTEPPESEIKLDGGTLGPSPLRIPGVPVGRHVFSASREGYVAAETALVVARSTGRVHLSLARKP